MSMRRIVLAAALACGAPAAAAAQAPAGGAADSAWVNLVTIMRLRDEYADRPDEAMLQGHPTRPWAYLDRPVVLPEPFRSRAFTANSHVLLDVDTTGRAAGCRPLRAGAHPELDAFACTLLMRPGYFAATVYPPELQPRAPLAGRWVMSLHWESLTAAAHRERKPTLSGTGRVSTTVSGSTSSGTTGEGTYEVRTPPPPRAPPRRRIRGEVAASDYRRIADQRMSDGRVDAALAVNERGVPTGCRVARSSGNQAIDERTCALLVDRVRFTQRVDASGTAIADTVNLSVDVDRMLSSRAPLPQPIQVGQTVTGRLESGDRVTANGTFYDQYTFTARSRTSLRLSLQSTEAELYLRVTGGSPPLVLSLGTNAIMRRHDVQVSVDVPAGASVRIEVNSYERGKQGAYTLQVTAN
ncbi:MAG TPA: hypothetical protein VFS20_00200 [Longimicrobium sp.]|nr:hypothetical protein [Longimicrobium sp.]